MYVNLSCILIVIFQIKYFLQNSEAIATKAQFDPCNTSSTRPPLQVPKLKKKKPTKLKPLFLEVQVLFYRCADWGCRRFGGYRRDFSR